MRIAYYVSGHGFGHATRSCVVAAALAAQHEIWIATPVADAFLRRNLRASFNYRQVRLDCGITQPDGLTIDFEATMADLAALEKEAGTLVERETDWLVRERIERVLVDIPPLACEAAARAGLPAAVITNFTWDDIYEPYGSAHPGFAEMAGRCRERYGMASLLFRLPFATPMAAFRRSVPIGLVARRRSLDALTVRERLGLGADRVALLSFGGLGLGIAPSRWNLPPGWSLIAVGGVTGDRDIAGAVRIVTPAVMESEGVEYADIVAAVDAVVTKPGYGIVSDCIANGARMIHTDRGPFAEYPYLLDAVRRHLPNRFIEQEALRNGDLAEALLGVMDEQWPEQVVEALTADRIRQSLDGFLGGSQPL